MIGLGQTDLPRVSLFRFEAGEAGAMTAIGTVAAGAGAMTGGAIQGALIGGLASWSTQAAATGALLGAGVAGTLAGVGMLGAAFLANRPAQGEQASNQIPPEIVAQLKWTGAGVLAMGAIAGVWGGVRVYKKAKSR